MKKKIAAILVSAMMAMSLCACGSKDTTTDAPATTTEEETTEAVTDATTADASADDASATDDSIQAERGVIDENNVYTNTLLGLSFAVDKECTIYSDKEILQILGYGQDVMQNEVGVTAEQLEKAMNGTFYDIWFSYPDGSNIYVAYENQTITGTEGLNENTYVLSMKNQFSAASSIGYTFDDDTTETYGGQEYACINAHTTQGLDQKVLLRKCKNYMICITVSYPEGDTEILEQFLNSITEVQ